MSRTTIHRSTIPAPYPYWRGALVGALVLVAAIIVATGFGRGEIPGPVELENGARMEWTRCWFWIPAGKSAHCGYYYPSRSRQVLAGDEKIRLAVIRIPANNPRTARGPILILHGGPGYPLGLDREGMRYWWPWIAHHDWGRDVVFFDQRGAGLSRPLLKCPEFIETAAATAAQALSIAEEYTYWSEATQGCRKRLELRGIDPSGFTTAENTRDVGELMDLLGGSDWNLYAASYGTRLAQRVAREYPQRLRSIVLDSVSPTEVNSLLANPFLMNNAVETIIESCAADLRCRSAFPNLEQSLSTLFQQLQDRPIQLAATRPDTGKAISVAVNDQRLMSVLYFALYDSDLVELIPLAIDSARRNDYTPMKPLVDEYVRWLFDPRFSDAVFLSVECHDLRPDTSYAEYMAEVARFPRVRRFVDKGWEQNPCRIWNDNSARTWNSGALQSKIPTVLLAGRFDPVTPPIWARIAAHQFDNSAVYEFPAVGHGVLDADECAVELVRDFFDVPDPDKQLSCIHDLRTPKFHIQFNTFVSKENLMPPIHINLTAVVVVAALVYALGMLWYSPLMFAETWKRQHGYTPKQLKAMQKKNGNRPLVVTAAAQFVMTLILAVLISYTGITGSPHGVSLGLLVWLGFVAPVGLIANMFSEKPFGAFWLDSSYQAIALCIMGGLLAIWH